MKRRPSPSATRRDKSHSFSLLQLPDDQVNESLSYLPLHELLNVAATSKATHAAVAKVHHLSTTSIQQNADLNPGTTMAGLPGSDRVTRPVASLGKSGTSDATTQVDHNRAQHAMTLRRLSSLLGRFRCLRSLHLHGLSEMGDTFLPILNRSDAAPSLVGLELHDCRIIRDGHNLDLHSNENRLAHIVVSGTLFVTYPGVLRSFTTSPNLTSIALQGARRLIDDNVKELVDRLSTTLQCLRMPHCVKISSPSIRSDVLRVLDMKYCTQVASLSQIVCPKLVDLDVSFSTMLADDAVTDVLASCPNLRNLNIMGCSNLRVLRLRSSTLDTIDLSLCSAILVDIACENLTALRIGTCMRLERLDLDVNRLERLDLSMLPMGNVFITSQSLTDLNLSGCFALTDDGLNCTCPKLEKLDVCGTSLSDTSWTTLGVPLEAERFLAVNRGGQPPSNWQQVDDH